MSKTMEILDFGDIFRGAERPTKFHFVALFGYIPVKHV